MISRRFFLCASVSSLVAACQTTTSPAPEQAKSIPASPDPSQSPSLAPAQTDASDLDTTLTPLNTKEFRVVAVNMTMSDEFSRSAEDNGVSNDQIFQTMARGVESGLVGTNSNGTTPVRVDVELKKFTFAGGPMVALGNASSVSVANTTIYHAETGQRLGKTAISRGASDGRPGGLIGIAMIQSPQEEVVIASRGLAKGIRRQFFGFGK